MDPESALLTAVRKVILDKCDFDEDQVKVEIDENFPPTMGPRFAAVIPDGAEPGPNQGGRVRDEVYNVSIIVVKRAANVPQDRRREIALENLKGLNPLVESVKSALHFNYDVRTEANKLLDDEITRNDAEGFYDVLRFGGMDPRLIVIDPDQYAGTSGQVPPSWGRRIRFRGAKIKQRL